MKKSMLTLVGCALAAGTVMAAEVAGNNTAVVIQKEVVASKQNYQFLIVPVKGFDITGLGGGTELTLAEILPPKALPKGTVVYQAVVDSTTTPTQYVIAGNATDGDNSENTWVENTGSKTAANDVEFASGTPFWLKTSQATTTPTVFCGEILTENVAIEPKAGEMIIFGNATSTAIKISDIVGEFQSGDIIYTLKAGANDYDQYIYSSTSSTDGNWTWDDGVHVMMQVVTDTNVLPAGGAAYFYRASN